MIDQWIWGCLGTPFSDKPHVWGLGYAEQSMDTTHISKSATNDDLTILEGKSQNPKWFHHPIGKRLLLG
jgi:hypothetical protein